MIRLIEDGQILTQEEFDEICLDCKYYHCEARKDYPCQNNGIEDCNLVEVID